MALYFTIYIKKGMSSFLFIILGIIVGIITLLLSEMLSMWIIAFLTTQDNQLEGNITMNDSGIS